jgi:hypothetical protein
MPLKHSTETMLVVFLGIAIMLAGIACAVLPSPLHAPLAWTLVFIASIVYPLSLYPLLKKRRADYEFRALHFVPAGILLIWLVLQLLSAYLPLLSHVTQAYVWGWSLPVVAAALVALVWFCLHVIRQRKVRLLYLAALFVPFFAVAMVGEQFQWPEQIASVLSGSASSVAVTGSGIVVSSVTSEGSSNLGHSSDETEEAYRASLRRMARRNARLAALGQQPVSIHGATDGVLLSSSASSTQIAATTPTGPKTPPHLPSSGLGMDALLLTFIAAYCAVLHERARRRAIA